MPRDFNRMKRHLICCFLVICGMLFAACSHSGDAVRPTVPPAQAPDTVAVAPQEVFTIVGTGDILLGMNWPENAARLLPMDGIHLFDSVRDILQNADVAFGNLEGVLLDTGGIPKPPPPPPTPCYRFRMPEKYVGLLLDAGYDFVSVANNHVMDFGAEARQHTIDVLDSVGLACAGSFTKKFSVIERAGVRFGLCAFSANAGCTSFFDENAAAKIIEEVQKQCDIVIVSIHAGNEGVNYRHVPFESEYRMADPVGDVHHFAHACIDAGADVVFGHGPHVARAVELYQNRIIAYSLGNFCTPYGMSLSSSCGIAPMLQVSVDREGNFVEGRIHAIEQGWGRGPRLDQQRRVIAEIQELTTADFPNTKLKIATDGLITKNQ